MKKLVSMLLVLTMVLSLAACGNSQTKETGENPTESSNGAATDKNNNASGDVSETREHMKISFGFFKADEVAESTIEDGVMNMLEEKFNVTFDWKGVSWSDYKEKYKLWAAAGELPDVFGTNEKGTETYYSWINQGIVKEFPEDLSKYPNIEKTLGQIDVMPLQVDGKNYTLPRSNSQIGVGKLTDRALIIRKDWLEEAGLDMPTNFDEFVKVVEKLQTMDLDGNGKDDSIGVTATADWALEVFFMDLEPAFASWSWVMQDGKYVPHYMSDQAIPSIERMKLMYENGVLDPDFAILQPDDGERKFAAENAIAVATKASMSHLQKIKDKWDQYEHDVEFGDAIAIVPLWESADGTVNGFNDTSYWSETYINGEASDEKTDRILEILDYMLTDEFKEICKYGLENVDYTKEGEVYTLMDETMIVKEKYPCMNVFLTFAAWNFNSQLERSQYNTTEYGEDIVNISMEHFDSHKDIVTPSEVTFDIRFINTPAKNKLSTINFLEDVTRIVVSGEDVSKEWGKTLDNYKAQGVEAAIEEVNAVVNE